MTLAQLEDVRRRTNCLSRNFYDSLKEKQHPAFPIPVKSNRVKLLVVLGSSLFEVVTEIQQRPSKHLCVAEQERNQKPTDSAVAIQKWVDRFELRVNDGYLDKQRQSGVFVEKFLELVQRGIHLCRRRRDERGFF